MKNILNTIKPGIIVISGFFAESCTMAQYYPDSNHKLKQIQKFLKEIQTSKNIDFYEIFNSKNKSNFTTTPKNHFITMNTWDYFYLS